MRFQAEKAVTCAVGLLLISGCATRPQVAPPPERVSRPYPAPRQPARVISAAAYVAAAGAIDLFEIEASELALERATMRRTRDFAEIMIRDHKGSSSQLSLAGRRLNLLPSAILDPRHQAMLDELRAAGDFDGTYRRQQTAVIADALALHSAYAGGGTSPTLRPVAAAILPVIQRHQRLLRYL